MTLRNQLLARGKRALYLAARLRLPRLAARLLVMASTPLPKHNEPSSSARRSHRVLLTNAGKDGFLPDVEDSLLEADDFEFVCWPSYALKAFAAALLSPSVHDANFYVTDDPEAEASKAAYRDFLARTWRHFCAIKPIDIVLTANFGFLVEREFGAALEEAGTPFVVLQKENLNGITPRRWKFWHSAYESRGSFAGRKILVYNEIERELQISSGIADPDRIIVTGMPRLDRIHKWRREHAGLANSPSSNQILFFGFDRKDKLPPPRQERATNGASGADAFESELEKLSWGSFCEETHRAMVQLARMRPDLRVIMKTKGQSRQLNDILEILDQIEKPLPSNFDVVTGGDPFGLITESRVVVGFNTTALIESVAAGKPVVVPWFGEACNTVMHDFIVDLGDAVTYAHSPEELIEMTCRYAERSAKIPFELTPNVAHILKRWVGNDDGAAGRRVSDAVRAEIAHAEMLASRPPGASAESVNRSRRAEKMQAT